MNQRRAECNAAEAGRDQKSKATWDGAERSLHRKKEGLYTLPKANHETLARGVVWVEGQQRFTADNGNVLEGQAGRRNL